MSISYSQDIESPPDYMTFEFFEEILENAMRQGGLCLKDVVFSMGSKTGENYCSLIYRVCLKYLDSELKEKSVIIKSIPRNSANVFLDDLKSIIKEKIFYTEVLPRMEVFLQPNETLGPRLYHYLRSPISTFVFEDLKCHGFEMASRQLGLDMLHCQLVMQRLGQFHASSMLLAQKDPEIMLCFDNGMLGETALRRPNNWLNHFFGSYLEALIEVVQTWPGYETILKKLQNYKANLEDKLIETGAAHENELKVLNHGDLWVNNMHFKYDKQRNPIDLAFIDFQMSYWSSPGLDLNYFFYTSLQLDILKHQRKDLLAVYHQSLAKVLKKQNYCGIPSIQQIEEEVRRREPYGFFANFSIYPLISMEAEHSGESSLENLQSDEFAKNQARQSCKGKRFQETLRYTLKRFDEMGIWD